MIVGRRVAGAQVMLNPIAAYSNPKSDGFI
jgi:hypothetical protein